MTLHLPPASDPGDREADLDFMQSKGLERCPYCKHWWHGLMCRSRDCTCDTAFREP